MTRQSINICSKIGRLLLPQHCMLCGEFAATDPLCHACKADLPWNQGAACPVCAIPSTNSDICGQCLKSSPAFDSTIAVLNYQFPSNVLLQAYKYGEHLQLGHFFARLLVEKIQRVTPRLPDLVVAMPLHPHRLKERGFNQAIEIARTVSRNLQLPLALGVCQRIRETPPQAELPLQERVKNIRGAFTCSPEVMGKRIAIVDDIMTSGASLDELARTLKAAGATEVNCWIVARTLAK